jgi:hypothetical protein
VDPTADLAALKEMNRYVLAENRTQPSSPQPVGIRPKLSRLQRLEILVYLLMYILLAYCIYRVFQKELYKFEIYPEDMYSVRFFLSTLYLLSVWLLILGSRDGSILPLFLILGFGTIRMWAVLSMFRSYMLPPSSVHPIYFDPKNNRMFIVAVSDTNRDVET